MRNKLTVLTFIAIALMTFVGCGQSTPESTQSSDPLNVELESPALQPVSQPTATLPPLPTATPLSLTTNTDSAPSSAVVPSAAYPSEAEAATTPAQPLPAAAPYPAGVPQQLVATAAATGGYPTGLAPVAVTSPSISESANVETVTLEPVEAFPYQLFATITGNHPDNCWVVTKTTQTRQENVLLIEVVASRPQEATCTQQLVPFSATYELDINGLTAGGYFIEVNGITEEFVLPVDNIAR